MLLNNQREKHLFRSLQAVFNDPRGVGVLIQRLSHIRPRIESPLAHVSAHFVQKQTVGFFRVSMQGGKSGEEAGSRFGGGNEALDAVETAELGHYLAGRGGGLQM